MNAGPLCSATCVLVVVVVMRVVLIETNGKLKN
jgi:hypothetical protein